MLLYKVTSKNDPTVLSLQLLSLKHISALCQNANRPCSISHNMEFLAPSNSASTWEYDQKVDMSSHNLIFVKRKVPTKILRFPDLLECNVIISQANHISKFSRLRKEFIVKQC